MQEERVKISYRQGSRGKWLALKQLQDSSCSKPATILLRGSQEEPAWSTTRSKSLGKDPQPPAALHSMCEVQPAVNVPAAVDRPVPTTLKERLESRNIDITRHVTMHSQSIGATRHVESSEWLGPANGHGRAADFAVGSQTGNFPVMRSTALPSTVSSGAGSLSCTSSHAGLPAKEFQVCTTNAVVHLGGVETLPCHSGRYGGVDSSAVEMDVKPAEAEGNDGQLHRVATMPPQRKRPRRWSSLVLDVDAQPVEPEGDPGVT
jgi:hypothetical protein